MTKPTSMPFGIKSGAAWIACAPVAIQERFLKSLTTPELRALPYLFEFWALDHQRPPEGDWRTWVILGGRGAGKTRAGAEWVRSVVEGGRPGDPGRLRRLALIGETYDQTREVMVFGESGILACSPPDRRPEWIASRKMLVWPNGATAQLFSASDPEALRGPQFDGAWVDELAKWKKAEETWDMLQFGLRLGDCPQICATTTPRGTVFLKALLEAKGTAITHAPTDANRMNLSAAYMDTVRTRYAGTRLGRQELEGQLLMDVEGALWTRAQLDAAHVDEAPELSRVVVAVDPPAKTGATSDLCGIVVVGLVQRGEPKEWKAFVLADKSLSASTPLGWARAAVAAYDFYGADRLVAEVNQGGDMIEEILRSEAPEVSYRALTASRGKTARAEPVAALYEQGRVRHLPGLEDLEAQMCEMTLSGFVGRGSPDRVDALVWAVHELMIGRGAGGRPRVRGV